MYEHKGAVAHLLPWMLSALVVVILVLGVVTVAPTTGQGNAVSLSDWSSQSCKTCHPKEWNDWSQSGHAMTLAAQLLNKDHNTAELLDQTCLKCHSPELGNVKIADIVQPIDQKGPWKLAGSYANAGDTPAISCLACHQPHAPKTAVLLPGMDFADESTFYRSVPAPQTTNLWIYDAFAQKYVEPALIAPVMNGDQVIPISDTRANRVCYTCHATERAESNLFESNTPPEGDNSVGTGDDRTLMGAHQGITCVACHMPAGSHTFNPMNACSQCHAPGNTTASMDYIKSVGTSYTDPSLSMLSGDQSPLNIHWLDTTQLWPPVLVSMTALRSGDTVVYTINIRNLWNVDLSNIDVRASIPAGAGYLDSQIVDGNNPGEFNGSEAYFNVGAIPAGQSFGPIQYRVLVGTAKNLAAHAEAIWEQPQPGSAISSNVAPK